MKLTLLATLLLLLVACTSKKKTVAENTNTPTEAQLLAVNEKYAGTTMDVLENGSKLYYGTCTNCHGAKNILSRSEEEWPKIIERMAPLAKINESEKDAVFKYVMAVKLAATKN